MFCFINIFHVVERREVREKVPIFCVWEKLIRE